MEKIVLRRKVVHYDFTLDASHNTYGLIGNEFGRRLQKMIFTASLAGMALFLSDCAPGYIASEPSILNYDRPVQPNKQSVWIDGEWDWNNRSQRYYQTTGYWDNPRKGQRYVSGHWQSTPKGKIWKKGYWRAEQ